MTGIVDVIETQISKCRAVRLKFIRQYLCRTHALVFQQFPHKIQGSPLVPALLNQDVQHLALSINCPPQVHLLAANIHEDFVQVPDEDFVQVPDIERGAAAFSDLVSIGASEFQHPQTNRFIADVNTTLGQQILDIPVAHRKAEVEPNGLLNDVRVKAVAPI